METDVAIVISGVVAGFVQVIKASGVSGPRALYAAAFMSLVGVLVYAFSFEATFERILVWKYFAAFGSVLLQAAGLFGLIAQAPEVVTSLKGVGTRLAQSMTGTGTGDGTANGGPKP